MKRKIQIYSVSVATDIFQSADLFFWHKEQKNLQSSFVIVEENQTGFEDYNLVADDVDSSELDPGWALFSPP